MKILPESMSDKNPPVVFIPVESAKRELDGKMVLASRLLERGFQVMVGTKSGIHREIMYARNGIYLAKSASNTYIQFYRKLKTLEHHLVVLDVEGGALTRDIRSDLLRSYQPESAPFFDYFFVFGEKIREAIIRDLPYIRPGQVLVTGEPRFDLLREKYHHYFRQQLEVIQRSYGNYVLINTSFGLSNSVLGEEGIRKFLETTLDIPDEQRHLYLLKHQEGKVIMKAFVDLVRRLSGIFPETNFVVRPHPDEDQKVYRDAFAGCSNVYVKGEGNVHPWIIAARAVIHHDCTTGMESVMAGKPVISYIPRMDESITAWLPVYLSIACSKEEEVMAVLREFLNDSAAKRYHPDEEKEEVFRSYFINYSQEAGLLLSEALLQAYGEISCSRSVSPGLLWKRFRSVITILRYQLTLKKHRERFMAMDRSEAHEKIHSLIHPSLRKNLHFKVKGGNVLHLYHHQERK